MTDSTADITKRRRPPQTGTPILVRLQPEQVRQLDDWRSVQSQLPSRPEAVRRLIQRGMKPAKIARPISTWDELGQVALRGISDAFECVAIIELVQTANSNLPTLENFDIDISAHLLCRMALDALILKTARAFDPISQSDDRHLRVAVEYLREAANLSPTADRVDRALIASAVSKFDLLDQDNRLKTVRHWRHKSIAHVGVPIESKTPIYNDVFSFASETCEVWEQIAQGTRTHMVPLTAQVDRYREQADKLWRLVK